MVGAHPRLSCVLISQRVLAVSFLASVSFDLAKTITLPPVLILASVVDLSSQWLIPLDEGLRKIKYGRSRPSAGRRLDTLRPEPLVT